MAIFFVFLILLLGYLYSQNNRVIKSKLSRCSGWESYALLGKHGLLTLVLGLIFAFGLLVSLWVLSKVINLFCCNKDRYSWLIDHSFFVWGHEVFTGCVLTLVFAFVLAQVDDGTDNDVKELKKIDHLLNVIVESSEEEKLVKISLLSGKVYVGKVDSEDIGHNTNTIAVIPFLSGYRNKVTKEIKFNCNYANVYKKNNLISSSDGHSSYDFDKIRLFRIVIDFNDIESLSLFDLDYYDDFEKNQS